MIFSIKTERFCIKITQKREILYQNHTKTCNFAFQMMKFAGWGWEDRALFPKDLRFHAKNAVFILSNKIGDDFVPIILF